MNHLFLERKYVSMISSRLQRYSLKKSSPFLANFRCPFCGDSQHDQRKARGYAYEKTGKIYYSCHNCSLNTTGMNLVKHVDPSLYDQYVLEKLTEEKGLRPMEFSIEPMPVIAKSVRIPIPNGNFFDPNLGIPLAGLTQDHSAWSLVDRRKISEEIASRWVHTENFYKFTNSLIPDKFSPTQLKNDHPRLIIPFYYQGRVIAYQGRSYKTKDRVRYITIVLDDSVPHIFGLDRVDPEKPIIVTEGPIDSTFIENAIAIAGGDPHTAISQVALLLNVPHSRFVVALDNERRHKDTLKKMKKCIDNGLSVCFWPNDILEKDINDMILSGKTAEVIRSIILDNAKSDMLAEVEFSFWKKDKTA